MLTFEPVAHRYFWNGQYVPHVTTVLAPLSPYKDWDTERMETARQKGQAVHKMIELDIKGTLDEKNLPAWLLPVLTQWRQFKADTNFHCFYSERRVYHAIYGYAGTLDLFGDLFAGSRERCLALIDLKRSFLAGHVTGMQLAAYLNALQHDPAPADIPPKTIKNVRRFAMRLREDGNYRMEEFTDHRDGSDFIAALALHNRSVRYGAK